MASYTLLFQEEVKNGALKRRSRLCVSNVDSSSNSSFPASRNLDFDSASNTSTATSCTTMDENTQVSGTTTRRQWSEWVTSKPRSHSAVLSDRDGEESENVSQATPPPPGTGVCLSCHKTTVCQKGSVFSHFQTFFSLSNPDMNCHFEILWFIRKMLINYNPDFLNLIWKKIINKVKFYLWHK